MGKDMSPEERRRRSRAEWSEILRRGHTSFLHVLSAAKGGAGYERLHAIWRELYEPAVKGNGATGV